MAKKHQGNEEANSGVLFDQRTKAVMAPHHSTGDNFKAKIAKVRECVPNNIKKDDIIIILEHFDNDTTKAISAFTDGDADSILQTWTISGKKGKGAPSGRNRRKRNRQGNQTVNNVENDANKTENIQNPPTKQIPGPPPTSESSNETTTSAKSNTVQLPQSSNNNLQSEPNLNYTTDKGRGPRVIRQEPSPKQNAQSSRQGGRRNDFRGQRSNQQRSQPQPKGPSAQSNSRRRDPDRESEGPSGDQRTGKAAGKTQVTKENTSTESNVQSKKKQGANLERLEKDLHRTTVSLTRCKSLLTNQLEDSEKRIKKAFQEVQRHLQEREIAVLNDFNDIRIQAETLIDNRQKTAAELKKKIDKANYNSLPEEELLELKASLKHFVSNRKTDEEIAQTMRFTYNPDQLITDIKSFGDVNKEVSQYSSRRPSLSSLSTISRTTSVCEDAPQPLSRGVSLSESVKSPDSPGLKSPDMDISAEADNFAAKIQQKFQARRGGPPRRGPRNPSGGRGRQDGGRRRQPSGGQQRSNEGQNKTQEVSKENQGPRRKHEGGRGDQKGQQQKDKAAATKSVNNNPQKGPDPASKSTPEGSPDAQVQKESPRKQRNFVRRQQHRRRQGNEGRQNNENHQDASPKKDEEKGANEVTQPTENGPTVLANGPKDIESESKSADIAQKVVQNGPKELNGVDTKMTAPQIEIDTSNDMESGASVGSTPVSSPGTSKDKQPKATNFVDKEVIFNGPLVNGSSREDDRGNGDEGYHEDVSTTAEKKIIESAEKKIIEREKLEKEAPSSSPPVINGSVDRKSVEEVNGES